MAPSRKSRSVNKRVFDDSEVSRDKDDVTPNHSRQRKRKLADFLGFQWSKQELGSFYEAYRKYGQDWKKVSDVLQDRSVEMVEALYNMNKAYLSLPDGAASAAGLIAMMTDHYNVLEGSSDRDSKGASWVSQKTKKGGRGKNQFRAWEDVSLSSPVASTEYDFWKWGSAVRKKILHIPVRKDENDNLFSPKKSARNILLEDDDEHGAALALTEASLRGGSPQVSQSPFKTDNVKPSPFQSRERMLSQPEKGRTKLLGHAIVKDGLEVSLGSRGTENGDYTIYTSAPNENRKRVHRKKEKVEDIRIDQFDDGWEAFSGTENGLNASVAKGEDSEVANPKVELPSSLGKRKRNKKLLFGDEMPIFDALQTLADLSLMMPASAIESESFLQLEEKSTYDLADRSRVHEDVSNKRDKTELLGDKEKVEHGCFAVEAPTSKKFKLVRNAAVNINATSEGEQQSLLSNKLRKRKPTFSLMKDLAEKKEVFVVKSKRNGEKCSPSIQGKSIRLAESSSGSVKRLGNHSVVSTAEDPATSDPNLSMKPRSRRKMVRGSTPFLKEIKSPGNTSKCQPNKYSTLQDKLSCCLSSSLIHRWCTFEWFYSAIDYPWFTKKEFVEYLNHVGLRNISRLSRVEWGVIRSSLGKPRRFSEYFLLEEREKLKQYRASVRKHYTELRAGMRDGLPTDLARPLSVGQRVMALHPKSRELHDGSVLTVDHDKYRIQFDRPELGVEFVMDIDCMPLNPWGNMPEAQRRRHVEVDKLSSNPREPKAKKLKMGKSVLFPSSEHLVNACSPIHTLMKQSDTIHAISEAKPKVCMFNAPQAAPNHPCTVAHMHSREADTRALTELTDTPDKKVSSALLYLRQSSTYLRDSLPSCLNRSAISSGFYGPSRSSDHHLVNYEESGSNVFEIIKESRVKAHKMVDAAEQAITSMKEGEDAFQKIGQALDSYDKQKFTEQTNDCAVQHPLSSTPETPQRGYASSQKLPNDSDRSEAKMNLELIASCVATFHMVQMSTEQHNPPGDVAQILEAAVTSLHPCCPQNLPIYREIQMCMGRIKTQILALVPTCSR